MPFLILANFDFTYGPKIFLIAPEELKENYEIEQITSLMDLYEKGFFVHIFGNFKSANLIFEIPSQYGRGHRELLLVSIVIDINSSINFDLSKELLEGFEKEFKKITDSFKAFYVNSDKYEGDPRKLEEVRSLFYSFYQTFPKESIVYDRKDAKILIFGLFQAGKTTIINCLKKTITKNVLPTTYIDVSRISVNNLSLYIYDTPGQIKYKSLWEPYLKNQDGLVFVTDISAVEKYECARDTLHEIAKMPELQNVPLLILLNKTDLIKLDVERLTKILEIKKLGNRSFQYFLTCGLTGKNVNEAFEWLTTKISNRLNPSPKRELGIIFSAWDESLGSKIISVYPEDIFEDPELIAIRCFSLSQYIFGGENFERVSVILPFTHLKVKAAIYFDFIYDDNVRGGKLPLALMIFYNEYIPRAIIDQFNLYIFEIFSEIKKFYSEPNLILKELKKIHNSISKRIKSFEPTVHALRIAELRYQTLFKAARDAIIIIDRKSGIIVDANEQAEKLLFRPAEDIVGLHSSRIKLEYNQNFIDKVLIQIELENSPPIEIGLKIPDNKIIPVEMNASEIKMGGQNLIQCILRDCTDRKVAEKQLKESENKYRHLFKSSPFAIFLIDFKGVIIDCNPAVEQLLGYTKEDLINKKLIAERFSIIHPKYILLLGESLKNVVKGENLTFLDLKLRKKNGDSIWANTYSSLVNIEEDAFIQIIANDITFEKEADLERKRALEALKESEAKFHDAYDEANFYKELFTHDIKELFEKITLSVEILSEFEKREHNKEDINDITKRIKEQTSQGVKIIDKVQKLSEIEESKRFIKNIEVKEILIKVIEKMHNIYPDKNLEIKLNASSEKFIVKANELLFDVFENILNNAIQYNESPKIDLEVKLSNDLKDDINYVKMEFLDNGIGISDEKKESIFQHGQDVRGLLLGLILVDRILTSYKGHIWIEDKVKGDYSKGSKFVALIPFAD